MEDILVIIRRANHGAQSSTFRPLFDPSFTMRISSSPFKTKKCISDRIILEDTRVVSFIKTRSSGQQPFFVGKGEEAGWGIEMRRAM
jgi:hypothetical protein